MSKVTVAQGTQARSEREIGFERGSDVDVKQAADRKRPDLEDAKSWEVMKEITYHARDRDFIVERGMPTDFASVPRAFVWFLPRYGRYTKAAILHDHLWREEVPQNISRIDADGIFRQAMRQLEVPFLRRWIMWAAVRWGALTTKDGRHGWLKEAPRVLLITIPALPIVIPAGVLVMVSLVVFWVVEWIVYLPLKLAERSKSRPGRPAAKRVNRPHFPWDTA